MIYKNKYNGREHKGKSLLKLVDDYVLVDIETTGLSPTKNEIIVQRSLQMKICGDLFFVCLVCKGKICIRNLT